MAGVMSFSRLEDARRGRSSPSVCVSMIISFFILSLVTTAAAHDSTVDYVPDVPYHDPPNITPIPGFGGYAQPSLGRIWPYDANSPEFLQAIANSNATGVYKFKGYILSVPWKAKGYAKQIDGWTLNVAALEIPGTPPHFPDDPVVRGNKTVDLDVNSTLGFAVTLKAPDSLIKLDDQGNKRVDAHHTQGMCVYLLEPTRGDDNWKAPRNKTLTEDGSCDGYLSRDCISALSVEFDSWYTVASDPANPYGSVVKCHYRWIDSANNCIPPSGDGTSPPPLFGYGEGEWFNLPSQDGVPIPYLNGSVTMSQTFRVSALATQQQGLDSNFTVQELYRRTWDNMVLNVWPVIITHFNATLNPVLTDGLDRYRANKTDSPMTQVRCIAPNGIGTGKAFTFSGEVPGTPPPPPPEDTGATVPGDSDGEKNHGVRGYELVTDKASLSVWALVLAFAAEWV